MILIKQPRSNKNVLNAKNIVFSLKMASDAEDNIAQWNV